MPRARCWSPATRRCACSRPSSTASGAWWRTVRRPAPGARPGPRAKIPIAGGRSTSSATWPTRPRRFDHEIEVADRTATASRPGGPAAQELLRDDPRGVGARPAPDLDEMRWRASQRQAPAGSSPDARGEMIDLRRALRQVARTGCVPPRPAWRRRKIKQRPVVLIADISGSMATTSRLILQLFLQRHPQPEARSNASLSAPACPGSRRN